MSDSWFLPATIDDLPQLGRGDGGLYARILAEFLAQPCAIVQLTEEGCAGKSLASIEAGLRSVKARKQMPVSIHVDKQRQLIYLRKRSAEKEA